MKLNPNAAALSAGLLGVIFYFGCYVIVTFSPETYLAIAQSWAHGVDLSVIWKPRVGNMALGLVSFTLFSALTGWGFAIIYNVVNGKS